MKSRRPFKEGRQVFSFMLRPQRVPETAFLPLLPWGGYAENFNHIQKDKSYQTHSLPSPGLKIQPLFYPITPSTRS
jgi:hypothetical protein